jgi:hypothetical protein
MGMGQISFSFFSLEGEGEKIPTYNGYEQKVVTIGRLAPPRPALDSGLITGLLPHVP